MCVSGYRGLLDCEEATKYGLVVELWESIAARDFTHPIIQYELAIVDECRFEPI